MDIWLILRTILLIFLVIFGIFFFIVFVVLRIIRKYYKFPIPSFMTRLIDNPIRRKLIQKPQTIAKRMKLQPGMIIIEIGPGKGNYTKIIANEVLPDGKVYAIDIQESIIKRLKQRIEKENISNIIPMKNDAYHLPFAEESIDRIFAIACLPEIPNPVKVLKEFKRIIKNDGIISLCEIIIDPDYPLRRTEKRWAKEAGLKFLRDFGNWFSYQLNFGK